MKPFQERELIPESVLGRDFSAQDTFPATDLSSQETFPGQRFLCQGKLSRIEIPLSRNLFQALMSLFVLHSYDGVLYTTLHLQR